MGKFEALRRRACQMALVWMGLCFAGFAPAAQLYSTQGYYDYTLGGVGYRAQNASDTGTCSGTSTTNYWRVQPQRFSVTIPAGRTVDKAYLFWTGSSDVADTQVTLSLNGGAGTPVTGTAQTGTVNSYNFYESTADVTTQLQAASPAGGTVNVDVSDIVFKSNTPDGWRNACVAGGGVTLVVVYTTDYTNPAISPRVVVVDDVTLLLQNASYTGNLSGLAAASSNAQASMTMATVEGDAALSTGELFSFNGTNYTLNWGQGDSNRAALNGDGDSWEKDTVNPTIATGSTSATYTLTTGQDLIMPVVMALSWNVQNDYGDAPASYGEARHTPPDLGDTQTRLGVGIDQEGGSQYSNDANGDDAAGTDDETGVTSLAPLTVASTSYSVTTACSGGTFNGVSQTGFISAWIDFNRNGIFDVNERAQATCSPGALSATLAWTIAPTQIVAGPTFLRVRIARVASDVANPTGNALSGEVEDFKLDIAPSVTINKKVFPASDTGVFNFSINGTAVATDIGNGGSTGAVTVYNKPLNNYNGMTGTAVKVASSDITTGVVNVVVSETGGTGTPLSAYTTTITCKNGLGTQVFSGDLTASTSTITLPQSVTGTTPNGQQQNISCEYLNQTAAIVVVKNTQGGDGTFAFTASGNASGSFNIATAAGTGQEQLTLKGIYTQPAGSTATVVETVPAGWQLTSRSCTYLAPDNSTGNAGTQVADGVQIILARGYKYTCTFANTKIPTLRIAKTRVSGAGSTDFAFDLTGVSGTTPETLTLTGNTTVTSAVIHYGTIGTAASVTETAATAAGYATSHVCVDAQSGITGNASISGNGTAATIPGTAMKAGAEWTCTFTNIRQPTVTLAKRSVGGVGTFSYALTGLSGSSDTITTTTSGTTVTSTTVFGGTAGTAASITENGGSSEYGTRYTCVDANAGITGNANVSGTGTAVNLTPANMTAGAAWTCTFTNDRLPTLTVAKQTVGGTGTFGFTLTGVSNASDSIVTSSPGTTVTSTTTHVGTVGTAASVAESSGASGYLTSYVCADANSAITGNANVSGNGTTANLVAGNMVAGAAWTCTFTNIRRATLTVTKTSNGGIGTFAFSGSNGITNHSITTSGTPNGSGTGTTQTLTVNGAATRVTEAAPPAGWTLTAINCSGIGSGTATPSALPSTSGGYVDLDATATAAGAAITCSFTNEKLATVAFRKAKVSNDATATTATFTNTPNRNLPANPGSITSGTTDNSAGTANAAQSVVANGVAVNVLEVPASGFVLSAATCVDANSAVTGNPASFAATVDAATGVVTIPAGNVKAGAALTCTLTNTKQGSITIIKDAVPNGTQTFAFTTTGTGLSGFTLDDDGNAANTNSNTRTFSPLASGSYSVTEAAVSGWTLGSLNCTGDVAGGTATTVSGGTATIGLDAGESITCTYVNSKQPTLQVVKKSLGGIGTFTFSGDNGYGSDSIVTATAATDTPGVLKTLNSAGTTTTITEGALPAGWTLSGISCSGLGAGTATPDLVNRRVVLDAAATTAGNAVVCTFTNTKAATLKVAKVSNGFTGSFDFSATGGAAPASFSIATATSGTGVTQTMTNAPTGVDIVVSELAPATPPATRWYLSNISCQNAPGAPAATSLGTSTITNGSTVLGTRTVNLVPGADVTCTFTNTVEGVLNLVKTTVGQDGSFGFTLTGAPAGTSTTTPSITTSAGTGSTQVLVPHSSQIVYDAVENANGDFQLVDIACTTQSGTASYVYDLAGRKVTITSQPGATKSCRFKNVHKPRITIAKRTIGGTGSFTLGAGSNGLQAANGVVLTTTATANPVNSPVSYQVMNVTQDASITETVPPGENWTTRWECRNDANEIRSSGTGTTLTALGAKMTEGGRDLTCIFINTKAPKLTVVKKTVGGANQAFTLNVSGGGQAAASSFNLTPNTDGGTAAATPLLLTPDTDITISEATAGFPAGWSLADMTCVNNAGGAVGSTLVGATESFNTGNQGGAITGQLVAGADVTCTFTNTRSVTAVVKKASFGGNDSFNYDLYLNVATPTGAPAVVGQTITTTGATVTAAGAGTYNGTFPSSGTGSFVVQEQAKTGWTLTGISCTQTNSTGTLTVTQTNLSQRYIAGTVTAGAAIECTFTNVRTPRIRIAKTAQGGDGVFGFTGSNGVPATSSLSTSSGTATSGFYVVGDITAPVAITENAVSGWTLTGAQCTRDTDNSAVVNATLSGNTLTVSTSVLQEGNNLTCTFTNSKNTKLTLAKSAQGVTSSFPFSVDVGGSVSNVTLTTTTPNGTASQVINAIAPNTAITIAEPTTSYPAGWSLASVQCVDNAGGTTGSTLVGATAAPAANAKGGSISGQLVAGADVTCTFTNSQNVQATVYKSSVGGNGSFSYKVYSNVSNPTPAALAGTFPATTTGANATANGSGNTGVQTLPLLGNGTFVVEEADPGSGWALTAATCTQVGSTGQLSNVSSNLAGRYVTGTVQPGTQIRCDFTNVRRPSIVIAKTTAGDVGNFAFTGGDNGLPSSLSLQTTAQNTVVTSSAYPVTGIDSDAHITEVVPSGWVLSGVACRNTDGTTVSSTVSGSTLTVPSSVLQQGKDIVCTFSNTRNVSLTVHKATTGGDGTFNYRVHVGVGSPGGTPVGTYPATTSNGVGNTGLQSFSSGSNGSFVVEEADPGSGWILTAANCSQVGSTGQLSNVSTNLANRYVTGTTQPGTQIRCDFTNVRRPSIVIAKTTVGDVGTFAFTGGDNGLPSTLSLQTTAQNMPVASTPYAVGSINVDAHITETVPSGWGLSGATCKNSDGNKVADSLSGSTLTVPSTVLQQGKDITCTFTNTRQARLTVRKVVRNDNGGTATLSTFNVASSAGMLVFDGGTTVGNDTTYTTTPLVVVAGTYSLTESSVPNYANGTWGCSGNGASAVVGTATAGSVTLADGADVICTITNDDSNQAGLSITKTNNSTSLISGGQTVYTLTVSNAGPARADGAKVEDNPSAGLDCGATGLPQVQCSATGGAQCPAGYPKAWSSTSLTTGESIPSLPAGGSVTYTLTCKVL